MGGETVQFLGALAAVVALVAITYVLGFRLSGRISSIEEAAELFRLAPGGFEPASIALDEKGEAAIARDGVGRIALLIQHGSQFVVRELPDGTPIRAVEGRLEIEPVPAARLRIGDDAGDWATTDIDANSG